jgi:hypothetical protein
MPADCNPAGVTGTVTADAKPGILAERCRGMAVPEDPRTTVRNPRQARSNWSSFRQ